jgi:oligopeptide transport system substrate-binding protein
MFKNRDFHKIFTSLFLLVGLLVINGCKKNENENKSELRLALSAEVSTIDPTLCYDTICAPVVSNIYESLFEYEYLKRPYTLRPLLAVEMPRIENGGLKYTFKLRSSIPYHPHPSLPAGRTVQAQDFVTAIKRAAFQPARSQGWWLFENKIEGLDEWRKKVGTSEKMFFNEPVVGLETPDELTLVIKLKKPNPQLLFAFTMTFSAPIPLEALKKNFDFNSQEIGTGPYTLKEYNPAQKVVLEKFDPYVTSTYPTQGDRFANEHNLLRDAGKKLPFISTVSYFIQKEPQTTWLNFLAEQIDIFGVSKDYYQVALTPQGDLSDELKQKNIKLHMAPTLIYWWIQFNMKDPMWGKNIHLRKAVAHAIDVDRFIKLFTNNIAQKANSIYPPGIPGYNPSMTLPYKYNLKLAQEYLKQAGYPSGKGLPNLTFDVRGNSTLNRQIGEFMVEELRKIGLNITVNMNTFPKFLERSRIGELGFWHGGWVLDYPDAENVLQLLVSTNHPPGPNSSSYSNSIVDDLFSKLQVLEDGPEKHDLMAQIESQVLKDIPWIMLYYTRNYVLTYPRIGNYRYSDIIFNQTKYLKLQ